MRLAPPFSDHAVLQRDRPIPVWGMTGPEQVVTVRLAGHSACVTSSPDGRWLVRLPPVPAGGPHELTASSASGDAVVRDVLVGEVWICSGQSNMEWTLSQTPQGLSKVESDLPGVRLLTISTPARQGQQTAIDGRWQRATQETLATFSAVGVWFGRMLHRDLAVPVGLICNAWGGTRIQAWMSREALMSDPLGVDEVRGYEGFAYEAAAPGSVLSVAEWERQARERDAVNDGFRRGWAAAGCDDSSWSSMPVPSRWQDHGHAGSGVFWFRRAVELPAVWVGKPLELHLGAIDKHDDSYVNGERIGGLSWNDGPDSWCKPRVFTVPAHLSTATLVIAVRARSHVYHGGMIGPERELYVQPADGGAQAIPLSGTWRYAVEQDWGVQLPPAAQFGPGNPNAPYTLFDSRMAPLISYGIRGAIWYQGESNANEAGLYRRLLPQMVQDWRRAFGQGDFPFLQVQLANFMAERDQPVASAWAELRDAQTAALADPQIGMAVAIDVGDAVDIHPTDKRTVGERLARWALAGTYGRSITPSGPLFSSMAVEAGGRVRCRFRHAGGLCTRDGKPPSHVAIAGPARNFVWAETAIEGDTLVVWSAKVAQPIAVRYAWADNPLGCNLVNSDDLPASPFRSDAWA